MKKVLTALLTIVITAGLFAGGQQEGSGADAPREITIWDELHPNAAVSINSLEESPTYIKAMENTGIKVNFIHPPQGGVDEHFNLMIASNDLPDMIFRDWKLYPGGPAKAIKDGIIIKLNDVMDKYMPNLSKRYEEHPEWLTAAKTDDGTLYHMPFIRGDEFLMTFYGPQLRKDWMDELGLEAPETLDDWTKVLTAFKEAGKAEYPLTFTKLDKGRGLPGQSDKGSQGGAFIQPFGVTWDFYQDDSGKVHFGPNEDGFKDFLVFFKGWYDAGLVDPELFTNERKTYDAKVLNGDAGAWVSYTGSGIGAYMDANKGQGTFDILPVKYPVLNRGDKPFYTQVDLAVKTLGMAITTQSENVAVAAEWADYAYGEEGHNLFNFGIEGESYNWNTEYPGYEGTKFPQYSDLMTNNPEGKTLAQMGTMFARSFYNGPIVQDKFYMVQYAARPSQQEAIKLWGIGETLTHRIPGVSPTPEESDEFGSIMSEIITYREEMVVKFIFGLEPIENFDAFRAQLKKMGVDKAIEIQQAALNRYNAR